MALQSSGTISLSNVNVELGRSSTAGIDMNETAVRSLAGRSSGQIAMSDFYGKSASAAAPGSVTFSIPGLWAWTVPSGVSSISVVCIGAGFSSRHSSVYAGAGGDLRYRNNYSVSPGQTLYLVVGTAPPAFTIDYESQISEVYGIAGAGTQNDRSYGSGGNGGLNYPIRGGCGAGGYTGNGGLGAASYGQNGTAGSGGAGGGGGGKSPGQEVPGGGGGGGVELYGQGPSGAGGTYGTGYSLSGLGGVGGGGGSYGAQGQRGFDVDEDYYSYGNTRTHGGTGGYYGGGGGYTDEDGGFGSHGAVRILWPGNTRLFPSTNVWSP